MLDQADECYSMHVAYLEDSSHVHCQRAPYAGGGSLPGTHDGGTDMTSDAGARTLGAGATVVLLSRSSIPLDPSSLELDESGLGAESVLVSLSTPFCGGIFTGSRLTIYGCRSLS